MSRYALCQIRQGLQGYGAAAVVWVRLALLLLGMHSAIAWDTERILQAAQRQGALASQGARLLLDSLARLSGQDDETKLQAVNQFFNRRVFSRDDIDVWGKSDYWATPLEMLARGQGDCEDYAIAKYLSLMMAGVTPSKLRLVYVQARQGGLPAGALQAHMVLAYYPRGSGEEPLILDNLISEIRPASLRQDLVPVFSFNAEGLWAGTQGAGAGDPLARLSRWRELLARVRAEGFL